MSKKLKKNKREKTEKELRRKTPTFLLELPLGVDEGPLKYRFFAGSASQAEGGNAISICSNGFPGGFTGNLSKKPILESGACPRPGGGTGVWLKFAPMGHGLRITYPQTGCSITKGRRALDARS